MENPERECYESRPRNMEGNGRGNRRDPESSQMFDELVKRKRSEEGTTGQRRKAQRAIVTTVERSLTTG